MASLLHCSVCKETEAYRFRDIKLRVCSGLAHKGLDNESSSAMKSGKDQGEVYYQCNTCQFVLKQRVTDPSPSYCPNCAIHHTKGTMMLVEEQQRAKGSPG